MALEEKLHKTLVDISVGEIVNGILATMPKTMTIDERLTQLTNEIRFSEVVRDFMERSQRFIDNAPYAEFTEAPKYPTN